MKFRKKPVVVEAIQFDGTPKSAIDVFDLFDIPGGKFVPALGLQIGSLSIPTLEGDMMAMPRDWIIRGVKGEHYPCKPDIFGMTYERVV